MGYKILLCNSQGREDKEKSYLHMLQRNQVDGIIAGAHNRGIEEYDIPNLPVVGFDRYLSKNTPVVSSDNYDGGRKATQLLINKKCNHIIHINGPSDLETPANLRRKAYEEVMKEHGRNPITYETLGDNEATINKLFEEHPEVDGIFASDDLIAATVLRVAKKRNRKIPYDLKVIGYDGTDTTKVLLPELSTIAQPIKDIAETCVDLLIKQIDGKWDEKEQQTILPVKLIESETTT